MRFFDSKTALVERVDEDNIHVAWELDDGKVVVFEYSPEDYPKSALMFFESMDEYRESIEEI